MSTGHLARTGNDAEPGEDSPCALHVLPREREFSSCQKLKPSGLDGHEEVTVPTTRETRGALIMKSVTHHADSSRDRTGIRRSLEAKRVPLPAGYPAFTISRR